MSRWIVALIAVGIAAGQQPAEKQPQKKLETDRSKPAPGAKEEVPPEEDASLTTTEYSFNPLQSKKDVAVGNLAYKNGKFRAAEMRYTSATKWNDGNAEAWLKLAQVSERLKDKDKARQAYEKYLEVEPDAKNAAEIRKKLEKLK
jgi:tetratricopeptide (TPR) repeat protein